MPEKQKRERTSSDKHVQFLEKKLHELYSIFDVARQLKSSLNLEQIVNYTTLTLMGHYGMEVVAVYLPSEENENELVPYFWRGLPDEALAGTGFSIDSAFCQGMIEEDAPQFMKGLARKFRGTPELKVLEQVSCVICVPLIVNLQLRGLITLGQRIFTEEEGQDEDLGFLVTSSSLIAAAIENARFFNMAITDSLTKLFTRRYFQIRYDEEFKRAHRYQNPLSVLMLDINSFKNLNDTYGHPFGDVVLKKIAVICKDVLRSIDFPARYGGDEFIIILPETPQDGAQRTADRITQAVAEEEFTFEGKRIPVGVSIGVSNYPADTEDQMMLLKKADDDLYRIKRERVLSQSK